MKKSIAMRWVKALRSGKYKQTDCNLKNDAGYCCLGVLCTLSPYKNNFTRMNPKMGEYATHEGEKNSVLPGKVQDWAKMASSEGKFNNGGSLKRLTQLNDTGHSFREIADIIENNYKKL